MPHKEASSSPVTPKHLWIMGVISLLWNVVGAFDYLMTKTRNEAYMSKFTPEQLEYFYGFPAWVTGFWAIAVWGAVLGSILLLLRKRLAVPVFAISLVTMVITTIYNYGLSDGYNIMGGAGPLIFSIVIFLIATGLLVYARAMANRGILH